MEWQHLHSLIQPSGWRNTRFVHCWPAKLPYGTIQRVLRHCFQQVLHGTVQCSLWSVLLRWGILVLYLNIELNYQGSYVSWLWVVQQRIPFCSTGRRRPRHSFNVISFLLFASPQRSCGASYLLETAHSGLAPTLTACIGHPDTRCVQCTSWEGVLEAARGKL